MRLRRERKTGLDKLHKYLINKTINELHIPELQRQICDRHHVHLCLPFQSTVISTALWIQCINDI
jgi:hypothetical protein